MPVGLAWAASLRGRPGLILHTADKKHPTPAGTYLTGCVFYAVLYHESPHGLTSLVRDGKTLYIGLTVPDATYLQDVAWRTVQQSGRLSATTPGQPALDPTVTPERPPCREPLGPLRRSTLSRPF